MYIQTNSVFREARSMAARSTLPVFITRDHQARRIDQWKKFGRLIQNIEFAGGLPKLCSPRNNLSVVVCFVCLRPVRSLMRGVRVGRLLLLDVRFLFVSVGSARWDRRRRNIPPRCRRRRWRRRRHCIYFGCWRRAHLVQSVNKKKRALSTCIAVLILLLSLSVDRRYLFVEIHIFIKTRKGTRRNRA